MVTNNHINNNNDILRYSVIPRLRIFRYSVSSDIPPFHLSIEQVPGKLNVTYFTACSLREFRGSFGHKSLIQRVNCSLFIGKQNFLQVSMMC